MQYSTRKSILENETIYTLTEHELLIKYLKTQNEKRLPYQNIKSIHLKYVSRKSVPSVFICIITTLKNNVFQINSQHFIGYAEFEDRKSTYTPFILGFHEKLTQTNINFIKGDNNLTYWFSILLFSILGIGMIALGISTTSNYGLIVLLVTIYLFFRLKDHFSRNKPGNYNPNNIPEELLPN